LNGPLAGTFFPEGDEPVAVVVLVVLVALGVAAAASLTGGSPAGALLRHPASDAASASRVEDVRITARYLERRAPVANSVRELAIAAAGAPRANAVTPSVRGRG
jgi:hypothetical protein